MIKRILLTAFVAIALLGLTACNKLDVIGNKSVESFEELINAANGLIKQDTEFGAWSLEAPDGKARFLWSRDFSKTTDYDILLEVDAYPFIAAGLDSDKLPEGMLAGDKLILGTELGTTALSYEGEESATEAYKQIVNLYRSNITYHSAMDHFGVDMGNGNMFEFAKDMSENDKDIVFVLNPQMLVDAGVDPDKVEGWTFAKVETIDMKGKMVELDKFLKAYDLDGKQ